MKRDIKLNMQALHDICRKINTYINALVQIETASAAFLETIKEQDSKAYERLSGLWEEKVTGNERDLKEKLETIETVLSGYIMEMESHIAPKDPALQLRVDRNDIWWNYTQIAGNAMDFGDILRDESGSYVDYGGWYLYNPFEDEKTNEARKQAMEAEEAAERGRRERNYRKLAEFREMLRGKMNGSIQESVHAIEDIHKDKVIPFENTDDRYKKLIDTYYDEWKSFGDGFADFWDVVCDIGSGLFGAVKDLFVGVIDLLKGVVEIAGWLLLKVVQADKIGLMPEALEEDVTGIFTGIGSILKDPGNALEAMGQSTFDNADEKGIAYSVSYIAADTAIGIFLDKGLKKLGKADDLVKPAGYSDEAADAAKYGDEAADAAMEAAERGDELAKGAEEAAGYADEVADGISGHKGTLTGKLDGLTSAERTMVNDLLNAGNNVEIIPRSNIPGNKTPDFLVNGIKTELKTLTGTSLNTPVTRIQDGFKQGAEIVMIDGRNAGLTLNDANTVIERALGKYGGELPGIVEIWTTEGVIRR